MSFKSLKSNRFYIYSLLIHFILIVGIGLTQAGTQGDSQKEGQGQGTEADQSTFIPKSIEVTVVEPEGDLDVNKPASSEKSDGIKECIGDAWYGGIGIKEDYMTGAINEIAKGYAADKAGLKIGDIISRDAPEIRGEPGTVLILRIMRDGNIMTFRIVREKICYV